MIFCQALFSKFFAIQISLVNLERSRFLGAGRNFRTSIGSFRFTSNWDSEVILLSQRLALKYNTTHPDDCQHFLTSFFQFLCAGGKRPLHHADGLACQLQLHRAHYIALLDGAGNCNNVNMAMKTILLLSSTSFCF